MFPSVRQSLIHKNVATGLSYIIHFRKGLYKLVSVTLRPKLKEKIPRGANGPRNHCLHLVDKIGDNNIKIKSYLPGIKTALPNARYRDE